MFYDQVGYVATKLFSFIEDFNAKISKCWSSNVEGVFNNAQLQCAFLKILQCKKAKRSKQGLTSCKVWWFYCTQNHIP
jgi:hypothetical protein